MLKIRNQRKGLNSTGVSRGDEPPPGTSGKLVFYYDDWLFTPVPFGWNVSCQTLLNNLITICGLTPSRGKILTGINTPCVDLNLYLLGLGFTVETGDLQTLTWDNYSDYSLYIGNQPNTPFNEELVSKFVSLGFNAFLLGGDAYPPAMSTFAARYGVVFNPAISLFGMQSFTSANPLLAGVTDLFCSDPTPISLAAGAGAKLVTTSFPEQMFATYNF